MKNRYIVKDSITLENYVNLVDGIVEEYFDNGMYQPHIGRLNAIRLFYNYFVTESPFTEKYPEGITTASQVEEIYSDAEFAKIFNAKMNAIGDYKFDFYNAFYDAMDIVESRKNSVRYAIETAMTKFSSMTDQINGILNNKDSIALLKDLAEGMKSGKITEQAVAVAMANKMK